MKKRVWISLILAAVMALACAAALAEDGLYAGNQPETDSTEKEWRNDRRVFSRQDDFLTAFMSREDGICVGQSCEIRWNGEE